MTEIPLNPWWKRLAFRARPMGRMALSGLVCGAVFVAGLVALGRAPVLPVIGFFLFAEFGILAAIVLKVGATVRQRRLRRREALEDARGVEWFVAHGLENGWQFMGAVLAASAWFLLGLTVPFTIWWLVVGTP